jgi:hypothetical protein
MVVARVSTLSVLLALALAPAAPSQVPPPDPGCHVGVATPRLAPSKRYVYERATLQCIQTNDGRFEYALMWRPRPGTQPRRIAGGEGIDQTFTGGVIYHGGGLRGRNWTLLCVRAIHKGPPRRVTRPLRGGQFATRATYYAHEGTQVDSGDDRLLDTKTSAWIRSPCLRPPRTVHVK